MVEPQAEDPVQPADDEPDDLEGFSVEESEAIAGEAARGRALDLQLAEDLEERVATTRAVSGVHIRELGQWRRLSEKRERELVRAAVAGDRDARAALVEAFLPLIGSVARNYRASRQVARVELMQEGVVGLLRALERFDTSSSVPFWVRVVVGSAGDAAAGQRVEQARRAFRSRPAPSLARQGRPCCAPPRHGS